MEIIYPISGLDLTLSKVVSVAGLAAILIKTIPAQLWSFGSNI